MIYKGLDKKKKKMSHIMNVDYWTCLSLKFIIKIEDNMYWEE